MPVTVRAARRGVVGHAAQVVRAERMNLARLLIRSDRPAHAPTFTKIAGRRRARSTIEGRGPMSELGLVLLLVGAALAVAEAHVPSFGALGAGAVVAVAAGAALLIAGAGLGLTFALATGLAAGGVGAGYLWIVGRKTRATRHARVRSGPEGLIGRIGEARAEGQVFLDGALWRARPWSPDEEAVLERGDPIVVERVDGLTLTVRRAEDWEVF
jgi:membrane-bound ClpP family serine protease